MIELKTKGFKQTEKNLTNLKSYLDSFVKKDIDKFNKEDKNGI